MDNDVKPELIEFPLPEIAGLLLREKGIVSGLWRLAARFTFQAVTMHVDSEPLPSGVVSLGALALIKADKPGPNTIDAAEVHKAYLTRAAVPVAKKVGLKKRAAKKAAP